MSKTCPNKGWYFPACQHHLWKHCWKHGWARREDSKRKLKQCKKGDTGKAEDGNNPRAADQHLGCDNNAPPHLGKLLELWRRVSGGGDDNFGVLNTSPPVFVINVGGSSGSLPAKLHSQLGAGVIPVPCCHQAQRLTLQGRRDLLAICRHTPRWSLCLYLQILGW